jgi:hypothetical protein
MRAAVVMVIGKHTIAPDAAPSVSCEQCLESSGIEWRADLPIDDDREGLVIGDPTAWIESDFFNFHMNVPWVFGRLKTL